MGGSESKEAAGTVEGQMLTNDWKCPFCESMNTVDELKCQGCNEYPGVQFKIGEEEDKWPKILLVPIVKHPFRLREQRIIVMGKMGVGKSAFCNTLMGRNEFPTSANFDSMTSEANISLAKRNERSIIVVDTPGFRDHKRNRDDEKVKSIKNIAECFLRVAPGFHCIALLLHSENRFSRDDEEIIEDVEKIFGEDVYGHVILVFTHCTDKSNLLKKLKETRGPLKNLLEKVEHRVFAIDNVNPPKDSAELFFRDIEELIKKRRRIYGNDMLIKAWESIQNDVKRPEDRLHLKDASNRVENMKIVHKLLTLLGIVKTATLFSVIHSMLE